MKAPHGYESLTPAYTRFISPERYARLRPNYQKWYRPYWVDLPAPDLPSGWKFWRNTDGSIGIRGPEPSAGESPRTSDVVYPSLSRDLHELLGRLADQQAAEAARVHGIQ